MPLLGVYTCTKTKTDFPIVTIVTKYQYGRLLESVVHGHKTNF
jgi:hypothetical protein